MEITEYIRNEISKHMDKHRVMILKTDMDEMVEEAMKGTYAFQIIYSDLEESYDGSRMFNYSFYSFTKLDHSKIVFRPETEQTSAVYSYDGGKRFQWFDTETLLLDPSIIREMKLNKIIK